MNAGNFHYFVSLWTALALPIQNAEAPLVAVLQGYVTGWFQVAVGAYLVCLMLIAAHSSDESSALMFFRQLFLASVIYALATYAPAFNTWVAGLALGVVNGVTTAMAGVFGGLPVTGAGAFDAATNNLLALGFVVLSHTPKYSWTMGILLGLFCDLYMVISVFIIGWLFLLYLLSSVILGFLIAFGPLFVACYFFIFTRPFCDGWVRTVVAAMLSQVFLAGLMTLFTAVIMLFVTDVGTTLATTKGSAVVPNDIASESVALIVLIAVCVLFGFIGLHLAQLAQSIASGAHAQFQRLPALPRPGVSNRGSGGSDAPRLGALGGITGGQSQRSFAFNRAVGSAD